MKFCRVKMNVFPGIITVLIILSRILVHGIVKGDWVIEPEPVYSKPTGSTINLFWVLNDASNFTRYNFAKLENGVSKNYIVKHFASNYTKSENNIASYDGIFLELSDLRKEDIGEYELTVNTGEKALLSKKVYIHVTENRADVPDTLVCPPASEIPAAKSQSTTTVTDEPVVVEKGSAVTQAKCADDSFTMLVIIIIMILSIICAILLIIVIIMAVVIYKLKKKRQPENIAGPIPHQNDTRNTSTMDEPDAPSSVQWIAPRQTSRSRPDENLPSNAESVVRLLSDNNGTETDPTSTPDQNRDFDENDGMQEPANIQGSLESQGIGTQPHPQEQVPVRDFHWMVDKVEETVRKYPQYEIIFMNIKMSRRCPYDQVDRRLSAHRGNDNT